MSVSASFFRFFVLISDSDDFALLVHKQTTSKLCYRSTVRALRHTHELPEQERQYQTEVKQARETQQARGEPARNLMGHCAPISQALPASSAILAAMRLERSVSDLNHDSESHEL